MQGFNTEMIEKAKKAKSAEELLELAKAGGVKMTADEAVTYFAQLNPNGSELDDDVLDAVTGGCGENLPLYIDYSMVKEFTCIHCFKVYSASECKVVFREKADDIAYCPVCGVEIYPSENYLFGKVY